MCQMFQRNWDKLYFENDLYVATGKNIFQMIATIFYIVSPYFVPFLFFFSLFSRYVSKVRTGLYILRNMKENIQINATLSLSLLIVYRR